MSGYHQARGGYKEYLRRQDQAKFTNYVVRLVLKTGEVQYHDFFVASREQARDYARRYAIERGVMWAVGHSGFKHGYELFAKVTP